MAMKGLSSSVFQWIAPALVGAALAIVGSSCSKERGNRSEVKTDLTALGRYFRIPKGVRAARWILRAVRPEGSSELPGPTDAVLLAYLETSPTFWNDQGHLFGARKPVTRRLRAEDARSVLPPEVLAKATASGDSYDVSCETLDASALNTAVRKVSASRCGTGILVSLFLG